MHPGRWFFAGVVALAALLAGRPESDPGRLFDKPLVFRRIADR